MDESVEQRLIRAAQRVLRPLVRILIRNGVTAVVFQELARKVFVDVTFEEFGLEGKPQTLARVSVMTGLNRKEVARLHKLPAVVNDDMGWRNRAAMVLAAWLRDDEFADRKGDPLDLPFADIEPSFVALVRKHSGDMQPRAVADELLRLGAIEEVGGAYRMTARGYVPGLDPSMMIDILGMDTSEFIETIDHNIQARADHEKLLQLKVLADNLPAEHWPEFKRFSHRQATQLLEELARWLSERDKGRDFSGTDKRVSAGVGVYQITRTVREAESPSEDGSNES